MSHLQELVPSFRSQVVLPQWLEHRQAQAIQEFKAQQIPRRLDQTWRFGNVKHLKGLDLHEKATSPKLSLSPEEITQFSQGIGGKVAQFIFANGQVISVNPEARTLAEQGLVALPLSEAISQCPERLEKYFLTQKAQLGSAKWATLHQALLPEGLFLELPKGMQVEPVIEVFHWMQGQNVLMLPHTLVIAGEKSRVQILEHHLSLDETSTGLSLAMSHFELAKEAQVTHFVRQNLNTQTHFLHLNSHRIQRAATFQSGFLQTGATWGRVEVNSKLLEPEADAQLLGINLPTKTQEYDCRTFQDHTSAHTTSHLLYKNILQDKAKTIFGGLINVGSGAHQVDAYQTCRNLLTSDEAQAHSMPGLKIQADQVKCSHGSTAAQFSDEELFYFLARGISIAEAKKLLAQGFAFEVLEKLDNKELRDYLTAQIATQF